MSLSKLPHFGFIDPEALEKYYHVTAEYYGREMLIDLNFENKTIEPEKLETIRHFIENIRIHDLKNKKIIENDFNDSEDIILDYINIQLDELSTADIADLTGNVKLSDQPRQLMKNLHIIRVGIYPDSGDFAVFDYSVGKDLTKDVIAMNTDENGNFLSMTMES